MSLFKLLRKLSGLVMGGSIIKSPLSHDSSFAKSKALGAKLPESNIVRKKKDWRFSKDEY